MPRLRDNQGRFVRTPHHLKTNPSSSGADSTGNTTPSEEDIQTLAERFYSGQHITLAEREILFAYKSQQQPFPKSSTQGKSSTITKKSSFLSFPPSDTDKKRRIRMAEEGSGSIPHQEEEESTFKFPIQEP